MPTFMARQTLGTVMKILGCLTVWIIWIHVTGQKVFPYFDEFLILAIGAFFLRPRSFLRRLKEAVSLHPKRVAVVLLIVSLGSICAGVEKFYASFLIWFMAVLLQMGVFSCVDYAPGKGTRAWFLAFILQATALYVLLAGTHYYYDIFSHFGTPVGIQYIQPFSPVWMTVFFVVPAFVFFKAFREEGWFAPAFWDSVLDTDDNEWRGFFYTGLAVLITIAALLSIEMIRPHFGEIVYLGDDSNYISDSRRMAYGKHPPFGDHYLPDHQPLYTTLLGSLIFIFGDHPEIPLIVNFLAVLGTLLLIVYAGQALTGRLFYGLLAGLLFTASRGTYLYVWTPLTEPLSAFFLAGSIAAALYLLKTKNAQSFALFGLAVSALLLFRFQGFFFAVWLVLLVIVALWRSNSLQQNFRGLALCAIAFLIPYIAWVYYRYRLTGIIEIADSRSAKLFLGYNAPGNLDGLNPGLWEPKYLRWLADHPGASSLDMYWAGLKYRFEYPLETATYLFWRTVELFHFRQPLVNAGSTGKPEISWIENLMGGTQTILVYGMLAATFRRSPRSGLIAVISLLAFFFSYFVVYCEHRYRYPGDVIAYLGVVSGLCVVMSQKRLPISAPISSPYLAWWCDSKKGIAGAVFLLGIALANCGAGDRLIPGKIPSNFVYSEPLAFLGEAPLKPEALKKLPLDKWPGRIIDTVLVFDGYRFRPSNEDGARELGLPEGNFYTASLDPNPLQSHQPSVEKIALDTRRFYVGPELRIGKHYHGLMRISSVNAAKMLELNRHILGYLLTAECLDK